MPRSCICALFGIQYQNAAFLAVPPSSGAFSSRTTSSPSQRAKSAAGRPPPPPPTTTTSASTSNGASAGTGADDARAGTALSVMRSPRGKGAVGSSPTAPGAVHRRRRIGTRRGKDGKRARCVGAGSGRGSTRSVPVLRKDLCMTTVEQPTLDPAKLEQFVFRAVEEVGATVNAALVVMGDRLGLYRAMAGAGALTPG